MVESYTNWVIRWKYFVALVSIAAVVAAAYGGQYGLQQ